MSVFGNNTNYDSASEEPKTHENEGSRSSSPEPTEAQDADAVWDTVDKLEELRRNRPPEPVPNPAPQDVERNEHLRHAFEAWSAREAQLVARARRMGWQGQ